MRLHQLISAGLKWKLRPKVVGRSGILSLHPVPVFAETLWGQVSTFLLHKLKRPVGVEA